MKRKLTVITILAMLPLIAAGIFALFGIIFSFWVYVRKPDGKDFVQYSQRIL